MDVAESHNGADTMPFILSGEVWISMRTSLTVLYHNIQTFLHK